VKKVWEEFVKAEFWIFQNFKILPQKPPKKISWDLKKKWKKFNKKSTNFFLRILPRKVILLLSSELTKFEWRKNIIQNLGSQKKNFWELLLLQTPTLFAGRPKTHIFSRKLESSKDECCFFKSFPLKEC